MNLNYFTFKLSRLWPVLLTHRGARSAPGGSVFLCRDLRSVRDWHSSRLREGTDSQTILGIHYLTNCGQGLYKSLGQLGHTH